MKINSNITALLIFSLLSLALLFPVFTNIRNFGVGDWDQHFVYNEVPRKTTMQYSQFPLWNPYYCGGNVMLAHPESSFLSPAFIFIILFGTVIGLKIQIIFHMILGMFGMYLLSKHLNFGKCSAFLPSVVYFMSSWFALRMNAGHTLYMASALLPFVFLFYLKAIDGKKGDGSWKFSIISALFMALIFFYGATYPFLFIFLFLGVYTVFIAVQKKSIKPIYILAIIVIITAGISAVKAIPVYNMVTHNPLNRNDIEPMSFKTFYDSLFSRDQLIESRIFMQGTSKWVWHEYGEYIGIIPFALFMASFFIAGTWPLWTSAIIFSLLYLGSSGFLWDILRNLPVFNQLVAPSRFNIIIVFCIALLAGASLSWLEKGNKIKIGAGKKQIVVIGIIVIIALDMFLISRPIYSAIFQGKPLIITPAPQFTQIFLDEKEKFNMMFPTVQAGFGVANCYEKMHVPVGVIPAFSTAGYKFNNYNEEVYLFNENISLNYSYFSPNKIIINVDNEIEDILIINQNYDAGWKSDIGKVVNHEKLLAVEVPKNIHSVELHYSPSYFTAGLSITIVFLIASAYFYMNPKLFKKESKEKKKRKK